MTEEEKMRLAALKLAIKADGKDGIRSTRSVEARANEFLNYIKNGRMNHR